MGYKIPNQFELNQIALRKKKLNLTSDLVLPGIG